MKLGLAFSGGKDSWACLWLAEPEWQHLDVIWVNTGKNYPETLDLAEHAKALVGRDRFHEVRVDREAQNEREGLPSDVVPIDCTSDGQIIAGHAPLLVQSYLKCCYQNIAVPLHKKALDLGVTHLIRGQRNEESKKGAARHGSKIYGITYLHPIESWTTEQVFQKISEHMEIPEHFKIKHSSLDCYDCSAFWRDSDDRMAWARRGHPKLAAAHETRLRQLKSVLDTNITDLTNVLEAT